MYREMNKHDFAFEMSDNKDHWFSYEWAELLFEYFSMLENNCWTEIDFDPVAFRCEYSEYTIEEYINEYCQEEFNEYYEENKREDEGEDIIQNEFFKYELKNDERIVIGEEPDCFIVNTNY